MIDPFIQKRCAIPNFDGVFEDEKKASASFKENSIYKPFLEDETVTGGPSFALDEVEKIINNPVNITIQQQESVKRVFKTPHAQREIQQRRCTQFFQNRMPTPMVKAVPPRPLLQPSPSPCVKNRPPCMAELFALQMEEETKRSPLTRPRHEGKSFNNPRSQLIKQNSIWPSGGAGVSFGFTCTPIKDEAVNHTPSTKERSRCAGSPVFVFDSPLGVEQRSKDLLPTPETSKKKRLKRKFNHGDEKLNRLAPIIPKFPKESFLRSSKKLKLSPIVQLVRRQTPGRSPNCTGLNPNSVFLTGKKLCLRSPLKCSLSPIIMMGSP